MHEASVAVSVIDYIDKYEKENRFRIKKVVIEAGMGAGISVAALRFCFDQMIKETCRNVDITFVEPPITGRCSVCSKEFILEYPTYVCPGCGGLTLDIISGMEFNLIELEGDEYES